MRRVAHTAVQVQLHCPLMRKWHAHAQMGGVKRRLARALRRFLGAWPLALRAIAC